MAGIICQEPVELGGMARAEEAQLQLRRRMNQKPDGAARGRVGLTVCPNVCTFMLTNIVRNLTMSFRTHDVVPISEARSRLTELAEDVVAGAEKVLTKNGSAYVAIVDARKLDYYHALEAEHGRLVMLDDAEKGLRDALAGRTKPLAELRDTMRRRAPPKK